MSKFMLAQFDDCMDDFWEVREKVIQGGFKPEIGPDLHEYKHISQYPVDHWVSKIEGLLGRKIIPRLSCFRQDWDGEMSPVYVHADDICAEYGSVLYMNNYEQCKGGTTFWLHQPTGVENMPTIKECTDAGVSPVEYGTEMNKWWRDPLVWTPTSFVSMKPNRFITYPTCRFHSRWPWQGWGNSPETGRMVWVLFYDFERPENAPVS